MTHSETWYLTMQLGVVELMNGVRCNDMENRKNLIMFKVTTTLGIERGDVYSRTGLI